MEIEQVDHNEEKADHLVDACHPHHRRVHHTALDADQVAGKAGPASPQKRPEEYGIGAAPLGLRALVCAAHDDDPLVQIVGTPETLHHTVDQEITLPHLPPQWSG